MNNTPFYNQKNKTVQSSPDVRISIHLENFRHQHISHLRAVPLPCGIVLFSVAIVDADSTLNQQGDGEQNRQQRRPGKAPVEQREQGYVLQDVTGVVWLADATPQFSHEQPAALERG